MVKSPVVVSAFITAFLVYSGIVPLATRHAVKSPVPEKEITFISGTIVSSPAKTSSGSSYAMLVELSEAYGIRAGGNACGRVKLYVNSEKVEALYPGKLYSASDSADAGAFIYETGAQIQASVSFIENKSEPAFPCTVENPQFYAQNTSFLGWRSFPDRLRALLRLQLKRILFAWKKAGGLLLALVCGAREFTDQDVSDAFRGAGLSHILALSGMHLSMFSSLTENTAGRLLGKKLQPLLTLAVSFLFVWFAGSSPSLVRALICMCISALAGICSLQISGIEKVSLSFLIHISLFPEDAGSAAFLLSYGALIGLSFGDCFIKPLFSRVFPPQAASSISASIGAQFCTTPVSFILFGECRPAGIIASVIVSPLASWFVTGGICALIGIFLLPFLLRPVGVIMNCLYTLIRRLVMLFAEIPGITLT